MTTPDPASPFRALRAVAIDLDGTLLSPDLSISPENRAAIEELHAAGVEIILASGRHYQSMLPHARKLPQVRYMVSAQGAYASDIENKLTLFESHMPVEDARSAIDFGLRENLSVVVYSTQGLFTVTPPTEWLDYYAKLAGITPAPSSPDKVLELPVFKVVYFENADRLDEIQKHPDLADTHLYTVRSLTHIFEQADPRTNKAAGLGPVLKHLGISPADTATFGDADNDIPMFTFSGYSIVMDRSWPTARKSAMLVAPDGPPETSFARGVQLLKQHLAKQS